MDEGATSYGGIGRGPGDILLDGDPAPQRTRQKGGTAAPFTFRLCLLWPNGRPSQQLLSSSWDMPVDRHNLQPGRHSRCIRPPTSHLGLFWEKVIKFFQDQRSTTVIGLTT